MKKSSLIALALAATLVLGGGGVYAAGQIARSNAISEENARSFAYVDAGILPEEAEYVRTKFDFSRGRFVYEIEFIAQGMHYEYTLDSVTGAVMEKEIETAQNAVARYTEPASAQTLPQPETLPAQPSPAAASAQILTPEEAKQLVLAHLQLDESSARILEAELEREEGQQLYEIKVKDPAGSTHEYKLHAVNGNIVKEVHKIAAAVVPGSQAAESSAVEATLPTQPAGQETSQPAAPTAPSEQKTNAASSPTTQTPGTVPQPTQPAATQPAVTRPAATRPAATQPAATQPSATQPAATRPAATQPAATQSPATQPAATRPAATQPQSTAQAAQPTRPAQPQPSTQAAQPTQPAQPQTIGVEAAKAIALKDAGQTAAGVVFTKARQEKEDGRLIYDIEFYVSGQMEYEYEIDAYSGAILEKDVEATEALKAAQRASAEASRQAAEAAKEASRKAAEEAARKSSEEAARQAAAEASRKAAEEASRKAAAEAARQAAAASSAAAATQPQVISVDKAKEIALKDAGLAASQVQFEKAKLEREDGRLVYEIEFFIRGQKEYDYEIDAYTGRILEKDVEDWDD